eukprot:4956911-Pyramimonas_sp.AAC.1
MQRAAEEICIAGWHGSTSSREQLRLQLLRGISQRHMAMLAHGNARMHMAMLEWRPDPSRMGDLNRARFQQWKATTETWRAAPGSSN